MKITTNFVEQASRSTRLLSVSIGFAGGLLLLAAPVLWWHASLLGEKATTLARHLAVQEAFASRMAASENQLPSSSEVLKMAQFAKDTQLLFAGPVTFAGFLAKLERTLPSDVCLLKLAYDQRNATATMTVESVNDDALTGLFAALEQDKAYRSVKLLKRSNVRIGKSEGGRLQIQLDFVEG